MTPLLIALALMPAAQQPAGPFPDDRRLDHTVELSASGQPLDELLASLSGAALRLRAGGDTPWERVSVYAHARPLRRVMADLATLLHHEWQPIDAQGASPPIGYVLSPTSGIRRYEREMLRQMLERGAVHLFRLPDFLQTSQEEWQRIAKDSRQEKPTLPPITDPVAKANLFYLVRGGPRIALALLQTLSSDQRFALLSDERLILNTATTDAKQRPLLQALGMDVGEFHRSVNVGEKSMSPDDHARAAVQLGLTLNVRTQIITGAVESFGYGVGGGNMLAGMFGDLPPPPPLFPVRGEPYSRRPMLRPAREAKPIYPALDAIRLPESFALDPKRPNWRDVLAQLAAAVPATFCSDDYRIVEDPDERTYRYYPGDPRPANITLPPLGALAGKTLPQALDVLCTRYRRLWWYEGEAVHTRSQAWFREREYEYPPAVEKLVREHLQRAGKFDSASLDAMARLSRKQFSLFGREQYVANPAYSAARQSDERRSTAGTGAWDYLQVWKLFSPDQKRRALAEGLPYAELNGQQQRAYLEMMFLQRGAGALVSVPKDSFTVLQGSAPQPGLGLAGVRAWFGFLYRENNHQASGGFLAFNYKRAVADVEKQQ